MNTATRLVAGRTWVVRDCQSKGDVCDRAPSYSADIDREECSLGEIGVDLEVVIAGVPVGVADVCGGVCHYHGNRWVRANDTGVDRTGVVIIAAHRRARTAEQLIA